MKTNQLKKPALFFPILLLIAVFVLAGCGGSEPGPTDTELPAGEATTAVESSEEAVGSDSGWSADPTQNVRVSDLGGDQALPKIAVESSGDFYVAWFSNPDGENYDVRIQRFNAEGKGLWGAGGSVVSDKPSMTWISDYAFTIDGQDNAVLLFQDVRSGQNNIYAYKISQEGEFLWGEDGLPVTDNDFQEFPFPDTVVTPEHITFVWERDLGDASALVLQKVTPDGGKVWEDEGLVVQGAEGERLTQGAIVSGGGDDIILVYGIETQAGSQVMKIYAQKLDGEGNAIWNDGQPVLLHESVPFFIRPSLVSDDEGGAYVAWHTTDLQGFVQHLDADGNLLMPDGGAPLVAGGTELQISPALQYAPDKQALYAFWQTANNTQRISGLSGQKMSPTGDLLWGEDGRAYIELTRANLDLIRPRLSGENMIVFYAQGDTAEDRIILETRLKALLIDENGDLLWEQPAVLSSLLSEKSDLEVGLLHDQEWVAVWGDGGINGREQGREILMQNLPLSSSSTQLANPAAVNCVENGGTSEIRSDDAGNQYGVCVFEDGSECDEWAYFRGDCAPGG